MIVQAAHLSVYLMVVSCDICESLYGTMLHISNNETGSQSYSGHCGRQKHNDEIKNVSETEIETEQD